MGVSPSTTADVELLLTLEELAEAAGMTARNVRAYRTRGLIGPPARRGRRAYYDGRHVEQLRRVRAAAAVGVPLALIKATLDAGETLPAPGGWARALGAATPGSDGRPQARLAHADDWTATGSATVAQLAELGVIHREGDGFVVTEDLRAATRELQAAGVELDRVLALAVEVARACQEWLRTTGAPQPQQDVPVQVIRLAQVAVAEAVLTGLHPQAQADDAPR